MRDDTAACGADLSASGECSSSQQRGLTEPGARRLTFPSHRHLRSGLDFKRIFAAKHKAANGKLVIFGLRNPLGFTRIGLSISRRHGNSVVRHRLRRLLREAYRLEQYQIPAGLDLVLIPGRDARLASQEEFRNAIVSLCRRLDRQLPSAALPESQSQQIDAP